MAFAQPTTGRLARIAARRANGLGAFLPVGIEGANITLQQLLQNPETREQIAAIQPTPSAPTVPTVPLPQVSAPDNTIHPTAAPLVNLAPVSTSTAPPSSLEFLQDTGAAGTMPTLSMQSNTGAGVSTENMGGTSWPVWLAIGLFGALLLADARR